MSFLYAIKDGIKCLWKLLYNSTTIKHDLDFQLNDSRNKITFSIFGFSTSSQMITLVFYFMTSGRFSNNVHVDSVTMYSVMWIWMGEKSNSQRNEILLKKSTYLQVDKNEIKKIRPWTSDCRIFLRKMHIIAVSWSTSKYVYSNNDLMLL